MAKPDSDFNEKEARDAAAFSVVVPKRMGPMNRLLGSRGIDGDGTDFEIEHVDPFIMCDYVKVPVDLSSPPMRPPFCAHPHSGNAVASILVEGDDMRVWDNLTGHDEQRLQAGGIYVVCTGTGCVHDEGPDPVFAERVLRSVPFACMGGTSRPAQNFRFFQMWFDPGHIHRESGPPAPTHQVVQPDAVPVLTHGALEVRVLLGEYAGSKSIDMPAVVLHCALLPFSGSGRITIPGGRNGFLFAMERRARVTVAAGVEVVVPAQQELLLPPQPNDYELIVEVDMPEGDAPSEAQADIALEMLVCFGTPIGKPFYKLLGYGGALVADSEEKVRALMREYERDPKNFGVPPGVEAVDMSRYGLQTGYKDPLDGRGECQREDPEALAPEARFYVLENGPYQPKGKGKGKDGK